ncbi:MAG: 4-hydroxythreonine-4-phosphate dehydrogenase PdxA [Cyanobacteria bacterium SID2]|nr:4-hydroxythreonine-4-phosphate dehydrogenase PdxA [Cyanobacteria bacterium SID2]MBP0006293.1 4-hydroxythreonine-4-phosphate dehydrogenase PdxA [Cyanobacteria bacterium SBC]
MKLPRLAVTLGDPAGIGPEIVLKALAGFASRSETLRERLPPCKMTVIGSRSILEDTYTRLSQDNASLAEPDAIDLIEIETEPVTPGLGTPATGAASFAYLSEAIDRTLAGQFDAIVTAPIAKSLWHAAGHDYPGQTERLAEGAGVDRFGMMFAARSPHTGWTLRTLLATTHIPLTDVPKSLTPERLTRKLDLLVESLQRDFGIASPHIAISGLNPHSGEAGKLGREEVDVLQPWLDRERQNRPTVKLQGFVPPDTLWVNPGRAWFEDATASVADGYLALYHDQGLIPVKLMAFDLAVNTTIGLPFVRTSPDHGTAFDIAGQGIARATSTVAAIELAIELASRRMG